MSFKRLTPINEAKAIQVIQIKSLVGEGKDDDPIVERTEYYSLEGKLLARHNPHTDDLDFGVWDVAKANRVEGDSK